MPNYVTNVLTIQAEPEEVRRILSAIQNDEMGMGSISFQKILPMPPALDIECGSRSRRGLELYQAMRQEREAADNLTPEADVALREKYEKLTDGDSAMLTLGEQCYNNIQNYGAPTWYEWRTGERPDRWGSKWDAFGYEDLPPYDGGNTIRFYTAWSSVPNVIRTLSGMFPKTEMEYRYADEDLGYNIGHMHFLGGHCIDVEYPLCQSAEAYEMAADIIGFNLEEHGWHLSEDESTYVFDEPDQSPDMNMSLQ